VTTLQKFVQMRSRQSRSGYGATRLTQPSEAEIRFAAYKEQQFRELRAIVHRARIFDRLRLAVNRSVRMLTERLRGVHRTSRRRAVGRIRRSSRSSALSDPDPAEFIKHLRSKIRPLCGSRRAEAFFLEHKNENARPKHRALSKGNRDDGYNSITVGTLTR
jgi:hypothetical protein